MKKAETTSASEGGASRRRRDDAPLLVIGPGGGRRGPGEAPRAPREEPRAPREAPRSSEKRERPGPHDSARHFEVVVHGLQRKLRECEALLKEKEAAIARLREELALAGRFEKQKGAAAAVASLKDVEVYTTRSSSTTRKASGGRPVDPERVSSLALAVRRAKEASAPAAAPRPARPSGRLCLICGQALRRATCANIPLLSCLSCRTITLELRAVRELARTHKWFGFIEKYLRSGTESVWAGR